MEVVEGKNKKKMKMKHFVLVHGACHGAWSWYKLVTLLRAAGHKVTALDLSTCGIDPTQVLDLRTIPDYFRPLMKFMDSIVVPTQEDEKVILVGHSLGGVSVSMAMETYPEKVAVAVFVTAFMPGTELRASTIAQEYLRRHGPFMDSKLHYEQGRPENPPTDFIFGSNFMASHFYQHSTPEDFALATMLARPQRLYSEEDLTKEIVVTKERYGSVARVYVIAEEDMGLKKDYQLWMIENNPPNEVKEIHGSDHMPMLSKPHELFACLQEIAAKY